MNSRVNDKLQFFITYKKSIAGIELPEKFTFPFYYTPHPLAEIAAKELQHYLLSQNDWKHNFGLTEEEINSSNDPNTEDLSIGKMFGVLVVETPEKELGYLCAFSGKLAGSNNHKGFVPPVYDMLIQGDFFQKEGELIIGINKKIETLENNEDFINQSKVYKELKEKTEKDLKDLKATLRAEKSKRKAIRTEAKKNLPEKEYEVLHEQQKTESLAQQFHLKKVQENWDNLLKEKYDAVLPYENEIAALKKERKLKSAALQNKLFSSYKFLNRAGEGQSLLSIFEQTIFKKPPAAAGECAAPKLLQYAFLNQLKPIALAEFWWGTSPSADIKKHLNYYPACRGKCEPILKHMLEGIELEDNPLLENLAHQKQIEIIYEDADLLVINKPEELLSVPGKSISDSVYTRIKKLYPDAKGPLIVHRLDMSTSGIMLIPLNKNAYEFIQRQFIKRQIKKRYIALLEGEVHKKDGKIELPLCLDINDRPRQQVSFSDGKSAVTHFEVVEIKDGKTTIYFYPHTGRTHQLRVHSAHPKGLDAPIVGDDLYGTKGNRLHLHAEKITFTHPTSKEVMDFQVNAPF